ncbi:hypothetical protein GMI70_06605 [Eggerthellaceae bacterium zg-893]|nr:hypothetical protein [Eggerthellaceae bacterium zg-893]
MKTSKQAESSITYCFIELRDQIERRDAQNPDVEFEDSPQDVVRTRDVLVEIAGLGRNGEVLGKAKAPE